MDVHPTRIKRPNRSAAARREQHHRANARAVSKLLLWRESLNHRGCAPAQQFNATLEQVIGKWSQSDSVPQRDTHSASPDVQHLALRIESNFAAINQLLAEHSNTLHAISKQVWSLQAHIIATPQPYSEASATHDLRDLVDEPTYERLTKIKAEKISVLTSSPKPAATQSPISESFPIDSTVLPASSSSLDDNVDLIQSIALKTYDFQPTSSQPEPLSHNEANIQASTEPTPYFELDPGWWQCTACGYKLPQRSSFRSFGGKFGGKCCTPDTVIAITL